MVATAILIESGLAFLGLGDPNVMSWGFQISDGRSMLRVAWWICTFPGIAILITVLAINLVGEGLNDALNPRLRGTQLTNSLLKISNVDISLPEGSETVIGSGKPLY